ncbi:MAG: DNA alkylation repair protein [Candidatus Micrarchaeota archaeon]|nr:DNA alkylation repair protein [Candidatus Micrarchaeota archaeon]
MRLTARHDAKEIIRELESKSDPRGIEGMKRFGIDTDDALGISVVELRLMARKIGRSHDIALALWSSGIHEARILASIVEDKDKITERQMDEWANDFNSWDICDQCCSTFSYTKYAHRKAMQWSKSKKEFVKRAGYAMMAAIAVHDKGASDADLARFLPVIKAGATDDRNYVKKSVNWALRQIGKRSRRLNRLSIKTAKEIRNMDSRSARWIASDAIRELAGKQVQGRLNGN